MNWKLDENLDLRLAAILAVGDDTADTVLDEGLSGESDDRLYEQCRNGGQVLVTLDLDFSNPLRFPPGPTQGIVVVRPPRQTVPAIRATLVSALPDLRRQWVAGRLWIVEPGRIRIFDPIGGR